MKHRLDLGALPELGAPEVIRTSLPSSERIHGPTGLYFCARGGVYGPGRDGATALLFADGRDGRAHAPWPFVGGVALRWGPCVCFAFDDGERIDVPGDVFALASEAPVGVVLDRQLRALQYVDLAAREARTVAKIDGGLERQVPGVMTVDAAGTRALVLDGHASGQVFLSEVNLTTGASTVVLGPLPARSWAVGSFGAHGERVLIEQRFAPTRARVIHQSRSSHVLLELAFPQPMLRPVFLRRDVVAAVLSTEPLGLATYGPRDLYLIAIPGGTRRKLTDGGDVGGHPALHDGGLEVDAKEGVVRWSLPDR
ncbi:MAG: hypothetical protein RIT81_23615 [Deltaproteobacteria bacterium]